MPAMRMTCSTFGEMPTNRIGIDSPISRRHFNKAFQQCVETLRVNERAIAQIDDALGDVPPLAERFTHAVSRGDIEFADDPHREYAGTVDLGLDPELVL